MKIEEPEEGAFSCYSNHFMVGWTAQDVKLQFLQLVDTSDKAPSDFTPCLIREAVVTVSWIQTKEIARLLSRVVSAYEELNGKLPTPEEIKVP
jgi:hypothetical protein